MLLGKRPRNNPMKRTTSLSEITFDLNANDSAVAASAHQPTTDLTISNGGGTRKGSVVDQRAAVGPASSPRNHRRASADFLETPSFLRSCSLCNRRLVPGRDIYMYRGDSAFCSSECRQQQMIQDERKEKCSMASKKELAAASAASAAQNSVSATGETTVAAV